MLSSDRAFQLHDTYGFPSTHLEMAARAGLSVDEAGFRRLMQEQKDRAKADAKSKKAGAQAVEIYRELRARTHPFTGYTELSTESKVRGIVVDGMLAEAAEGRPGRGCLGADAVLRRIGRPGLRCRPDHRRRRRA